MTVVLVTHDQNLVNQVNRRVVLLKNGQIQKDLPNSGYIHH